MTTRWYPLLLIVFMLLSVPLTAQDDPAPVITVDGAAPFGIVEGMWYPELTCALGVGWERIIFDWSQHQPEGQEEWYTLNVDDRWLKAANACGREVVAIVKNVPAWATDGTPGPGVPRGLDLPHDDPGNLWAAFMRKLADYYSGRGVHRYIVLNEPDIDRDTYGFEFEGTLEDYALMLKGAYLAVKDVDPGASIHLAATTYWHDANSGRRLYMDRLLEHLAQDPDAAAHVHYFDVFSLHIYFRTETIPQIVGLMRGLLDQYGMGQKAIWINETNAAPTDDPNWPVQRPQFQVDLEQQAAFLIQAAALSLASGVERVAAYKLFDQNLPPGGESFGLLTPGSGQPRPAFYAWQMVSTHFVGVIEAEAAKADVLDAVRLSHVDGRVTLVLWARRDQAVEVTVRVPAGTDKLYHLDMDGTLTLRRPDADGTLRLRLPPARCNDTDGCAVGGRVSTLVLPGPAEAESVTVAQVDGAALVFSPDITQSFRPVPEE